LARDSLTGNIKSYAQVPKKKVGKKYYEINGTTNKAV
jgi:hypothetical protein